MPANTLPITLSPTGEQRIPQKWSRPTHWWPSWLRTRYPPTPPQYRRYVRLTQHRVEKIQFPVWHHLQAVISSDISICTSGVECWKALRQLLQHCTVGRETSPFVSPLFVPSIHRHSHFISSTSSSWRNKIGEWRPLYFCRCWIELNCSRKCLQRQRKCSFKKVSGASNAELKR